MGNHVETSFVPTTHQQLSLNCTYVFSCFSSSIFTFLSSYWLWHREIKMPPVIMRSHSVTCHPTKVNTLC